MTYPYDPPPDVIAAWAKDCECCSECSPTICAGVAAGGLCDKMCFCDDEEYRDDEGTDDGQ